MKSRRFAVTVCTAVGLVMLCATFAFALSDKPGFKDPGLFTRMPGFVVIDYKYYEFNKFDFLVSKGGKNSRQTVEGRYNFYSCQLDPASGRAVSNLQMIRNFQNAATQMGGKVLFDGGSGMFHSTTLMIQKPGKEIWVNIKTIADKRHEITIVEKETMAQDVAANPMLDQMRQTGRVTLYINFDTGSATIKPASYSTIDDIVAMLKADESLRIAIEGHTDNTGDAQGNQYLSDNRANSVMSALTAKGINGSRLSAKGFGRTKPIADNSTPDGRAKNRRVELVRQ